MSERRYQELENRTIQFSKELVRFCYSIKAHTLTPLVIQLIKSSTSVGANYRELNEARTLKEKLHIITIIRRELKETQYWIEIFQDLFPNRANTLNPLVKESKELMNIFMAIYFRLKPKN